MTNVGGYERENGIIVDEYGQAGRLPGEPTSIRATIGATVVFNFTINRHVYIEFFGLEHVNGLTLVKGLGLINPLYLQSYIHQCLF